MPLGPDLYRRIFAPDCGSLLDILIFDASSSDWQKFLDYVTGNYVVSYSEDDVAKPLPDLATIFQHRDQCSVRLEALLPGFTLHTFFFTKATIDMDLLPDDVDSAEKAESVFRVMKDLSLAVGRPVYLVPEFGGADDEQLRAMAICTALPDGSFTISPNIG